MEEEEEVLGSGGEVGLSRDVEDVEEEEDEEEELEVVVSGDSAGVTMTSGGLRGLEQRGEWRQCARWLGSHSSFSSLFFSEVSR